MSWTVSFSLGAIFAQAAGIPVSGLAAAAGMVAFLGAAMLTIVGANQVASRLYGTTFACVGVAIILPMLAAVVRDPRVLALFSLALLTIMILMLVRGLGTLYAAWPDQAKRPTKRQESRRGRVLDGDFDEPPELPRRPARHNQDDYDFIRRGPR